MLSFILFLILSFIQILPILTGHLYCIQDGFATLSCYFPYRHYSLRTFFRSATRLFPHRYQEISWDNETDDIKRLCLFVSVSCGCYFITTCGKIFISEGKEGGVGLSQTYGNIYSEWTLCLSMCMSARTLNLITKPPCHFKAVLTLFYVEFYFALSYHSLISGIL